MAKQTPARDIRDLGVSLAEVMSENLSDIADEMVAQCMSQWRDKKPAITGELSWPGENAYRKAMADAITIAASDAIDKARGEVPQAKNVKLFEDWPSIQLASTTVLFQRLPKPMRDFISKQNDLLVSTQLKDLEQNLKFQYMDSYGTSDDEGVIEDDLRKVCVDYIDGQAVRAGANLLASKTVNESRSAFFFEPDVLEYIEAFQFLNADPVTPICQDLDGTVFAKDDPNMFRYTPPLHWNCKSYIVPVLNGNLPDALKRAGQDRVEPLKPSTKKLEDQIQFSEAACNCAGCT